MCPLSGSEFAEKLKFTEDNNVKLLLFLSINRDNIPGSSAFIRFDIARDNGKMPLFKYCNV